MDNYDSDSEEPEEPEDLEELEDLEEFEGYNDIDELTNSFITNREKISYLTEQKLNLLLQYSSGLESGQVTIDEEVYRGSLKKIDKELLEIEVISDDIEQELIEKEIQFTQLLEEYINISKKKIPLSSSEINKIKTLFLNLKEQIPLEPEESLVYEYDADGFISNWEVFEKEEFKEAVGIAKKLKINVKVPKREKYKTDTDFDNAVDKFMKTMIPYLPGYISKMNVTRIGVYPEKVKDFNLIATVKNQVLEAKKLKIKLSESDEKEIQVFNDIKNKLNSKTVSDLIDCIQDSTTPVGYGYIEELKMNKVPVTKYQPQIIKTEKEPENLRNLVLSLLKSLGLSFPESASTLELQDILNNKYSIPPNLYFKKNINFTTITVDPKGKLFTKTNIINSRTPMILIKKEPIPQDIKINNELYYETVVPLTDSLYSALQQKGAKVEEIWMVPSNGILKKILKFEDYLSEIKIIINSSIILSEQNLFLEKNPVSRGYMDISIRVLKDKVYQIDEYLKNGRILPPYNERLNKQFSGVVPGFTYVTKWQRKVVLKKLTNLIQNNVIATELERIISDMVYSVQDYYNKVENIYFILTTYPEIKLKLITGDINLYQFVIFDKNFNNKDKPSLTNRKNILNLIKSSLTKSLQFKFPLLGNTIVNRESKRIELLLFDLTETSADYTTLSKKLSKLLNLNSFSSDLVLGNITTEQLLLIINRFKSSLNKDIMEKALSSFKIYTTDDIIKMSLKDTKEFHYRKLTVKDIDALLSQERNILRNLLTEKSKYDAVNNTGRFIDNWVPPTEISNSELKQWNGIVFKIKNTLREDYTTELIKFRSSIMKKYHLGQDKSLNDIKKDIVFSENNIHKLQKIRISKIKLILRIKKLLLQKNKTPPVAKPVTKQYKFPVVNENLINELVQAFKRKLIIDNYRSVTNSNKLIDLLELYDLNDLYVKINIISKMVYDKIKYKITTQINNVIKDFDNEKWYILSVGLISESLGIVNVFTEFPEYFTPQKTIIDYYTNDLLLKLYTTNDVIKFYSESQVRQFDTLVSQNKIKPVEPITSEMVLFNPANGKFGKEAYDGYLFPVQRLEKDLRTNIPVIIDTTVTTKNPRLGINIITPIKYEKPGKTYFLKLPIINPSDPEDTFRWKEVPSGAVGKYPSNYDSCSRFKIEQECSSGTGIANSKCYFENNICKAKYY